MTWLEISAVSTAFACETRTSAPRIQGAASAFSAIQKGPRACARLEEQVDDRFRGVRELSDGADADPSIVLRCRESAESSRRQVREQSRSVRSFEMWRRSSSWLRLRRGSPPRRRRRFSQKPVTILSATSAFGHVVGLDRQLARPRRRERWGILGRRNRSGVERRANRPPR